jgi:NADH-quinone oxidoreductase subunit C
MAIPEALGSCPDAVALAEFDASTITGGKFDRNEWTINIDAAKITRTCEFLRVDRGYVMLTDLTATDSFPLEPRFQIVYHLLSVHKHQFLRLKAAVHGDVATIDSVTGVWPTAGWFEREVYDLFGVFFNGHADLRRIVMPDAWEGYPLRKDYPTEGPR